VRIYLPRIALNEWTDLYVDELTRLAAADRFRVHELVASPEEADVVLFVQPHMVDQRLRAIRSHRLAKANWRKVMVYDERDRPWRSFPGIYVSVPLSKLDERRQRTWSYLSLSNEVTDNGVDPDLLFSFVGSCTHESRRPILELRHPAAILEEVTNFVFWDNSSKAFEERRRRYREVVQRSRFVLCPRGRGPSSFRIYESLAAGRVPVIISDEWSEPVGPDWRQFSIRVPERDAMHVPSILQERAHEWPTMSRSAAAAWNEFFSHGVRFHRMASVLEELKDAGALVSGRAALATRATTTSLVRKRPTLSALGRRADIGS
jgi:hypothetical protein